ncbi:MAG TPA: tetratricopeptide repeat protein, partial [Pyrinomonadaceae bacterium]|nr:tetratricopeptide repeat protein [Pyrinomonadaceae bacterium]
RPWQRENAKPEASGPGQPQLNSIAVLPFKAIGAESEDEYLSLGLADALITRLGNVREIVVRPTSAIRRYTEANQDPIAIGRRQGVDAVLEGSFQRQGDRLRLTVQLIRVADGATLWSAQFDERFTDIFSVQDSISERVACDLVTRICGEANGRPAKQKPVNIEAYEAYLKGRYFWNKRTRDGFRKAVEYFKQALEIDPTYARAYAGLGDAYGYLGGDDAAAQAESAAQAKAGARRALELDETLGEAHASLGLYAMNNDWDWAGAEKEFKRAIELNPNYATAHQWYGEFLAYMGRFDEAIAEIERAHDLDPLSLIISTDVAKVYYIARRHDEAITQYKRTLDVDPDFAEAHALLALAYSTNGQHEEAVAELLKVKGLENNPPYLSWLVYVYGRAGRMDEAQRVLKRVKDLSQQTYVSPLWMAVAHTGLGEKDQAFAWFEKVFAERSSGGGVTLKVNPLFDSLRSDPRFQGFLRRAGSNL